MAHGDRLYLSHILDAADRIEHYLAGVELVAFLDDFLRQDGVIRQLAIIGEGKFNKVTLDLDQLSVGMSHFSVTAGLNFYF